MRTREYNYQKFCEFCGASFSASRFDAKFCSSKHRSAHHRKELKRSREVERIKQAVDSLLDAYRQPDIQEAIVRSLEAHLALRHVSVVG